MLGLMVHASSSSTVTPAFRNMRQEEQKFQVIVRLCIQKKKKPKLGVVPLESQHLEGEGRRIWRARPA